MQSIRRKADSEFFKFIFVLITAVIGLSARANAEGADREWAMRVTRLNKLQARIQSDKKSLFTALLAKRAGHQYVFSHSKKINVLKQIIDSYKDMSHSMSRYNHQTEILKYEYPEEGAVIDRHYVQMRKKSLHNYETQSGLERELTALKNKINKKYSPLMGHPLRPTVEQIDKAHDLPVRSKTVKSAAGRLKLSE